MEFEKYTTSVLIENTSLTPASTRKPTAKYNSPTKCQLGRGCTSICSYPGISRKGSHVLMNNRVRVDISFLLTDLTF